MSNPSPSSSERRSFLRLIHAGAAAVAALAAGGVARAQAKAAPAPFAPTLHPQDDWMDQIPGKHRLIIDTSSPDGFKDGLQFANNFLTANRTGYGLESKELAIIVVARHLSAGFGFNNEMWAKYGASLAGTTPSADAQPKEPPKSNPDATPLTALSNQGVQFAVCALSARRIAGTIARANGGTIDDVLAELSANLAKNARLVPAGIVALNRAQERGYTLARA
jgi:intracellular sulfur oxidation DsrE/DsrF family protein